MNTTLANTIVPLNNEPYMSPRQIDYFREKLLSWRDELTKSNRHTLVCLEDQDELPIEIVERSVQAQDREILLKTRSRNWDLIRSIDQALDRIADGTFGYCQETDEPIGFARLDANPVALYSLSVQETLELKALQQKSLQM